jgi:hypothetical protein
VVARYEREDPFATTTADESRSTRFCGVHRPGSSQGQPSWPRHGRWRVATEARAERAQPVDHDQSAFQGIHALNPLMLVDRLAGFRSRSSMRSMPWPPARMVACWRLATPDDPSSHFAQICKPRSGWNVVTVSAFDTPAYTGEEVPEDLLLLILPKWIEATQKRTLEHTRRPIIAANIARFGEDETVIMRREGGWIRVYRARHLCPLGACA